MSKPSAFERELLLMIFNGSTIPGLVTTAGGETNLTVALHTGDPGETGTQITSEATYTGYSRVSVPRTSGGWTVTAAGDPTTASPVAVIDFGEHSAGSTATITHWSIGIGGATPKMLYSGTVTPSITMAVGVIPRLKTTSTVGED